MTASYESSKFGGEVTEDGYQFKFSSWSRYAPSDLSDLDKEIVQVCPAVGRTASHAYTHCCMQPVAHCATRDTT